MPTRNRAQALAEDPNRKPREVPAAQLLHHFHVEYPTDRGMCALRPGQVVPVWDLNKWRRVGAFAAHCSNAVRWQDALIAADGYNCPVENSARAAAFVAIHHGATADPEQRALIGRLSRVPLGNVGGRRTVRPDALPIGVVPMEARRSYGEATFETEQMSVLSWSQEIEGMEVADHILPEFGFFVEDASGDLEGFDAVGRRARVLTPIELPFSWSSGEELDVLVGDGEGIEREMQTMLAMTDGVRRLASARGMKGVVYFGWDLPPASQGLPEVDTDQMPLDYFLSHRAEVEVLYEIPFLGENPLDILNQRPRDQIRNLLRGVPSHTASRTFTIAEAARVHQGTF